MNEVRTLKIRLERLTQAFFLMMLLPNNLHAQELDVNIQDHRCITVDAKQVSIVIVGEISPGLTERLENLIGEVETRLAQFNSTSDERRALCKIYFYQVPGGDMYEAMRVARLIRANQLETGVVWQDNYCNSACVLAFSGGVSRMAMDGKIGIHSFYFPDLVGSGDFSDLEAAYQKVYSDVDSFLAEMRINRRLLDAMVATPHSHIRYLTRDELWEFNLNGVDPVFVQGRPRE